MRIFLSYLLFVTKKKKKNPHRLLFILHYCSSVNCDLFFMFIHKHAAFYKYLSNFGNIRSKEKLLW